MTIHLLHWKRDRLALAVLAAFYVIFGIIITLGQETVIYKPNIQDFQSCPGFANAQKITTEGTRMYFVKSLATTSTTKIAVLYHGNGGSACDRAFMTSIFVNAGYSFLVPEYAGYSNDRVSPSHEAIKADVLHVITYVKEKNYEEVLVVGESIGSGFAAYHVSLDVPDRLILLSPFTNLVDVAKKHFWYYPVALMVDNAFDNEELLESYSGKALVIHGDADMVIPAWIGEKLFLSMTAPDRQRIIIPGAGHNDLFEHPNVYEDISDFIR